MSLLIKVPVPNDLIPVLEQKPEVQDSGAKSTWASL
jgi:hypothetical protein